jgi:formylglycine-generating enzyme required for sulfatase activity
MKSITSFVAIVLASAAIIPSAAQAASPAPATTPGSKLVVIRDGTELRRGKTLLARLSKGTEFTVTQSRGAWVGGYAVVKGKKLDGWIARERLDVQAAVAAPQEKVGLATEATVGPVKSPSAKQAAPAVTVNSIGLRLTLIPAGEFMMGTSTEEIDRLVKAFPKIERKYYDDEYPPHRVRIARPFYLGVYEVTVGQFRKFVDDTGYRTEAESDGKGGSGWKDDKTKRFEQWLKYTWRKTGFSQTDEHPVVNVSWNDATAFCEWLSLKEGKTYRLPTEAEWEYACRAGTTTWYHCGDNPEKLATVGNVADRTAKTKFNAQSQISARDGYAFTAPVGRFRPNAFGLYDMHGNVCEWCDDWYDPRYYANSAIDDPAGPTMASGRVWRGGSFISHVRDCRAAIRDGFEPSARGCSFGFRVARVPSGRYPPHLAERRVELNRARLDLDIPAKVKVTVDGKPAQAGEGQQVFVSEPLGSRTDHVFQVAIQFEESLKILPLTLSYHVKARGIRFVALGKLVSEWRKVNEELPDPNQLTSTLKFPGE